MQFEDIRDKITRILDRRKLISDSLIQGTQEAAENTDQTNYRTYLYEKSISDRLHHIQGNIQALMHSSCIALEAEQFSVPYYIWLEIWALSTVFCVFESFFIVQLLQPCKEFLI